MDEFFFAAYANIANLSIQFERPSSSELLYVKKSIEFLSEIVCVFELLYKYVIALVRWVIHYWKNVMNVKRDMVVVLNVVVLTLKNGIGFVVSDK